MAKKIIRNFDAMDLDPDIIMLYLSQGLRKPKNEKEKRWLRSIRETKKKGMGIEFPFN
ncbi:hypothetical protein GCM10027051_03790 [Niabella terrae]